MVPDWHKNNLPYCLFKIPDEDARIAAIGSLAGENFHIKKSIKAITPFFRPIPEPKPNDWLWEYDEDGQSFESYKTWPKNYIDEKRNKIYIYVLSPEFDQDFKEKLKGFCSAFFGGVKIVVKKGDPVDKLQIPCETSPDTNKPIYDGKALNIQKQKTLPADAFCLISILMEDIYHREASNYVYGLASLKDRTGAFSFARFDPKFLADHAEKLGIPTDELTTEDSLLLKSCKVVVHEICHMFGIRHCIHFSCVMNGSNGPHEERLKPIQLCPVCVRKLQHNIGFNIRDRYMALEEFCNKASGVFAKESEFYRQLRESIDDSYVTKKAGPKKQSSSICETDRCDNILRQGSLSPPKFRQKWVFSEEKSRREFQGTGQVEFGLHPDDDCSTSAFPGFYRMVEFPFKV